MKAHRIILLPHLSERLASNILRNIVLLSLTLRHLMYHLVPSFSQLHIASCYLPHTIALSLPHADVIPQRPSHTFALSFSHLCVVLLQLITSMSHAVASWTSSPHGYFADFREPPLSYGLLAYQKHRGSISPGRVTSLPPPDPFAPHPPERLEQALYFY